MMNKKSIYLMILFPGILSFFLVLSMTYKSAFSYLNEEQQEQYLKLMDKKAKIMEKYNMTEDELDSSRYMDVIKEYGLTLKERIIFTDLLFLEIQEEDTSICGNLGLEEFDEMKYCKILENLKSKE